MIEVFYPKDGMAFAEEGHVYTLKGVKVPFSLTQVIRLAGFAPEYPDKEAARLKAELGTKVHEYTLWLDQGEMDLSDLEGFPEYANRVAGWVQFRADMGFTPDLSMCEVPLGIKVNGMLYATKVDAYGVLSNGDLAVVEKKCTAKIEPCYALQTAGEALAFKAHAEAHQSKLRRFCVQLLAEKNAAGKFYNLREYTDDKDERVFVHSALANVYSRLNMGLLKQEGK